MVTVEFVDLLVEARLVRGTWRGVLMGDGAADERAENAVRATRSALTESIVTRTRTKERD